MEESYQVSRRWWCPSKSSYDHAIPSILRKWALPLGNLSFFTEAIRQRMGALKGMFVRHQPNGVIVLSWHDLRDAKKAYSFITTNLLFNMDEPLSAAFIDPFNLIKVGAFHFSVTFHLADHDL
jgi:hypothetical protein